MATILSIDTPAELRRLDAKFERPAWRGWLIVRAVFILPAAMIVLLFAVVDGSIFGSLFMLALIALIGLPIISLWWRLRRARQYRMPILHQPGMIREAHAIYADLSVESQHEYGAPLIRSMYRLAAMERMRYASQDKIHAHIGDRLAALRGLLDAEQAMRLWEHEPELHDRDAINAADQWAAALKDVREKLATGV